ncbi:MAG: hypothetical protein HUU20_15415 [Pirellulales bacterium]|nr:hypothetical protein [Pirellulales bacterium]
MQRREFIRSMGACGALLGGTGTAVCGQGCPDTGHGAQPIQGLPMRPCQLLCGVCAVGQGKGSDAKLDLVRENPDIPVTLTCNAGDVFAYQDPGPADALPGSAEFNRRRDLEILQRLDLFPGATLPARIILHRIWDRIETVSGICSYENVTADAWKGCPLAAEPFYKKGREICLSLAVPSWRSHVDFSEADLQKAKHSGAIILPRTKEERAIAKKDSLEAMRRADAIPVRPHILICAVCQYGDGSRPPYETDNLPEMLQFILKNPNAKIRMADNADWMMCAPCPSMQKHRVYDFPVCVNGKGCAGLTSQLRDVRVLQVLGLRHGDVVNARELYRKIFDRITSTVAICGTISNGVQPPSVWWSECGHHSVSLPEYVKGRKDLIQEFGFSELKEA